MAEVYTNTAELLNGLLRPSALTEKHSIEFTKVILPTF